jgi:hypothetical protein
MSCPNAWWVVRLMMMMNELYLYLYPHPSIPYFSTRGYTFFGNTFPHFGNTIYKTPNTMSLQWNYFTTHIYHVKSVQTGFVWNINGENKAWKFGKKSKRIKKSTRTQFIGNVALKRAVWVKVFSSHRQSSLCLVSLLWQKIGVVFFSLLLGQCWVTFAAIMAILMLGHEYAGSNWLITKNLE